MYDASINDRDLEQQLLKVKFVKEINRLFEEMDQGDFFRDLDEYFDGKDSFLLTIVVDTSGRQDAILKMMGVSTINEFQMQMQEDRIFKRIIKMLAKENLGWDFRQNKLSDKTVKGYILQLSIYKK